MVLQPGKENRPLTVSQGLCKHFPGMIRNLYNNLQSYYWPHYAEKEKEDPGSGSKATGPRLQLVLELRFEAEPACGSGACAGSSGHGDARHRAGLCLSIPQEVGSVNGGLSGSGLEVVGGGSAHLLLAPWGGGPLLHFPYSILSP